MPLANTYKKIAALERFDVQKETQEILLEYSEDIIQLVRGQMASKGTTGLGKPIMAKYGAFYSDATVREKTRNKSGLAGETEHITMFNTGEFYSTMYLQVSGTKFEILSEVDYFDKINAWNDFSLVELDAETLKYVHDVILLPNLKERFNIKVKNV